jgi:hypothetical protein
MMYGKWAGLWSVAWLSFSFHRFLRQTHKWAACTEIITLRFGHASNCKHMNNVAATYPKETKIPCANFDI